MAGIIRALCPSCGKGHTAPAESSGMSAKCRKCGSDIVFPESPETVYDRPLQLAVDPKNARAGEIADGPGSEVPLNTWRVVFAVAVLGLLSISPLLQLRDQWSARSDAARMREINRRIVTLKLNYESEKEAWASNMALAEMKSDREKMKAFKSEEQDRFRQLKANFEGSYYRVPEATSNLAEQRELQLEYRDALWRHPDWNLASETFPTISVP